MTDWTPKELAGAYRAALKMAAAAERSDGWTVAEAWNAAEAKDVLVWALSRLPAVMIAAVSERTGAQLDPAEVLKGLADCELEIDDDESEVARDVRLH